MHQPTGIRVGDQLVARLQNISGGPDASDIIVGVAADFQLEPAIPVRSVVGHVLSHFGGRPLGNGSVQHEVVAIPSAQQFTNRHSSGVPQDVPTGDVDRRLYVGMPFEHMVHFPVQHEKPPRVIANQSRRQLLESSPHASCIGR